MNNLTKSKNMKKLNKKGIHEVNMKPNELININVHDLENADSQENINHPAIIINKKKTSLVFDEYIIFLIKSYYYKHNL